MPNDIMAMTDDEIISFISDNSHLFASAFCENFHRMSMLQLSNGTISIERRPYGFAIVQHENRSDAQTGPFRITYDPKSELVILYIIPAESNKGNAKTLVSEIVAKYMACYAMDLKCEGVRRRDLFIACGFEVEEEVEGTFYMARLP